MSVQKVNMKSLNNIVKTMHVYIKTCVNVNITCKEYLIT